MGICEDYLNESTRFGSYACVEFVITHEDGGQRKTSVKNFNSLDEEEADIVIKSVEKALEIEYYAYNEKGTKFRSHPIATQYKYPHFFSNRNPYSTSGVAVKYSTTYKEVKKPPPPPPPIDICERKRIYRRYGTINAAKVEITQEKAFFLAKIPLTNIGVWETVQTARQSIYFPNRRIEKISFQQIDFTTNNGEKYLGRRINLIDEDGKHFLKGFYEGDAGLSYKLPSGLFKFSSHFIASPISPITRTKIQWSNWDSDIYEIPEDLEEKYVFIDDYSTILDADQFGLYKFDKASVGEFDPADYFIYDPDIARELREDTLYINKGLDIDDTITTEEFRKINGFKYKHTIREIPIISRAEEPVIIDKFILHTGTDDGVTWYEDNWEIISGECDVNVFNPNPWKFPKIDLPNPDISLPNLPTITLPEVKVNFPKVPVVDIRDYTIDIGEFVPLFSGLHEKLDNIIQRLERVENEINSVQLPNITWEVPSVGIGDPNLGTENSYPPSEKGLQRTFDHLGIILRGLGNTIAHNKSVIGEVGDVIGVRSWRKGYQKRKPAEVPISLRKIEGEDADEIEIYNLTQLFEWYIRNFDELIGQFDTSFEIADSDLTEEGEQPTVLTAQNIAEALTEIWGASTLSLINSELIVQIALKAMVEAGQAKKSTAVNHTYLQAIVAYLNFEQEDLTFDMPLTFTPGKEDMAEILEETNCESEGIRFKGKDTLQSSLQDLLQAAAITRAKNFIGLGKDLSQSEISKKIVSRIKEVADNKKWLQNFGGSFDDFIKDVESGFTENKPGAKSVWQDGQEPEITELEIPRDNNK